MIVISLRNYGSDFTKYLTSLVWHKITTLKKVLNIYISLVVFFPFSFLLVKRQGKKRLTSVNYCSYFYVN